ncbi:hypothetical protein NA57DRAFT_75003 [Rhizodiscina lignyota]|uniref:UBC core domain-containing protein n=1 Tax=Rhizodiscina lignyota TaxID=1504668 RepID=A0A9P4IHQ0_9PEZI|nr:hypothetical protein NA57DRAFT_75003 [Rhizodiscina lignyota]
MAAITSFMKQNLLLEFSSLKHASPDGVYVTLTPGDPSLWSGVMFVRTGPYAPAILRFQLSFPPNYPSLPPLVTFSTEIFHPLLTPLTAQSYATSTMPDGSSPVEEERLPPGGFSLRHGFPQWFKGSSSNEVTSTPDVPVFRILEYMRAAFNDETVLDSIPSGSAANAGAYHAWHTYRAEQQKTQQSSGASHRRSNSRDAIPRARRPGEWNWEGVWEQRVQKGVRESLSEPVLFGSSNTGDEIIRFSDLDEEAAKQICNGITQRTAAAT